MPDQGMNELPVFETPRLFLRRRGMQDLDACLEMDRDPEVVRYIDGPWSDPALHRAFIKERITTSYPPGLGYWSVFDRARPDRFLGWILLIPRACTGPEVEIGWRFNRSSWGNGYATEAALPVLRHGFLGAGLDEIIASIDPDNVRSIRVVQKLGLLPAGRELERGRPSLRFALTRAQFLASPNVAAAGMPAGGTS